MDIILIPGFWLTGPSWDGVRPALESAGHRVHALTLPGKDEDGVDPAIVTLSDHVAAVVTAIDKCPEPPVIVGHSGGGSMGYLALDQRPELIAQYIFVDTIPMPDGTAINDELPSENDVVPFPGWDAFGEEMTAGLDDSLRASIEAQAKPEPAAVARTPVHYRNYLRHHVPLSVLTSEMSAEDVTDMVAAEHPWMTELSAARELSIIDFPGGHWPMFDRPDALASAILAELVDEGSR